METAVLRDKLHEYIHRADERKLSAIYVFVEDELEEKFSYDSETISMLHERRNNHISGASKSYTAEESLETIRGKKRIRQRFGTRMTRIKRIL